MEELQTVKRIRIGNAVCVSLFLLFLPACLVFNYLFPGKLTVFAVTYIVVIGCVAYPVSFMPCPRCGQTFNMYHPFDREHGWVNDGGGSGGGNCIYCGFPFTQRGRSWLHRLGRKLYRFISS